MPAKDSLLFHQTYSSIDQRFLGIHLHDWIDLRAPNLPLRTHQASLDSESGGHKKEFSPVQSPLGYSHP
jgi:hypothetical protein